jgi:acyl-CoA synthetase (AMP-forming)/AMP-acid ligase II
MNAPLRPTTRAGCLASRIAQVGGDGRWLWDGVQEVSLQSAISETRLNGRRDELAGKSVLIRTRDQLSTALLLIELDSVARRLILCPPDLDEADLPFAIEDAAVDAMVGDLPPPDNLAVAHVPLVAPTPRVRSNIAHRRSEWVMFTSGTTGRPKMVVHSLDGLTGAIKPGDGDEPPIWGTFYDIRRYGGLQMLLRAFLGGGSMILSRPEESTTDFLVRLGQRGVTHLSATPSHWRKALMSPSIKAVSPHYLRLSGEIADQAVLDNLQSMFPRIPVGHAYASTEAGVGFEVNDGLEGFPAEFVGRQGAPVEIKVEKGSLRLRSARTASDYVGASSSPLADDDGFVDTGDMVEQRGDRYYFVGRRGGIINVGGLKIHPEEVEAVINRHPAVRMSLVKGRRNPITGAIVVADVVAEGSDDSLKDEILADCRAALPAFKVPTSIRFVDRLAVTAGGKLERRVA